MPPRSCAVSFCDLRGITHSVEVTADSLFEAAAMGLKLLQEHGWLEQQPGPATRLEIHVSHPTVKHEVTVRQILRWVDSTAVTPDDRIKKDKVRNLLP
jgi:hypothetical protein